MLSLSVFRAVLLMSTDPALFFFIIYFVLRGVVFYFSNNSSNAMVMAMVNAVTEYSAYFEVMFSNEKSQVLVVNGHD